MRINEEILKEIKKIDAHKDVVNLDIEFVTSDSRKVKPNTLYVAKKGGQYDGHDFIDDARQRGACAVVISRPSDVKGLPYILVEDSSSALSILMSKINGDPTKDITLIGVTGTDGKSSNTYLIESGMKNCGIPTGVIGTIEYRYDGHVISAPLTTPDPEILFPLFREMKEAGVKVCVMEVSSHAIDQKRIDGCRFDIGIFTNLTRDHLDYHKTLEAYGEAKKSFFTRVIPNGGKGKGIVVFIDDPFSKRIIAETSLKVLTYSLKHKGGDIYPKEASYSLKGINAVISTPWGEFSISSPLIGPHNLANMMAAIGVAGILGISLKDFVVGVERLDSIPGRLQRVQGDKPVNVFVDYAHTPTALENSIKVLKSLSPGTRLITVMGAGGDRDKGKRPIMGEVSGRLSDFVIITSDNPRSENPLSIIREIEAGICGVKERAHYMICPDRRQAIYQAINMANENEIVLIAGKGHEKYQIIGNKKFQFDDVEVAKKALKR